MPQTPEAIRTFLDTLSRINVAGAVDILLIASVIYGGFIWLKGTTGMALVRGAGVVIVLGLALGSSLNLTVVNWLLRNSIPALLISVPIVFQPEIRRALEWLGRPRVAARRSRRATEQVLNAVVEACIELSTRRLGALIVLERDTGLDDYIRTGERMDAVPSRSLIVNVFWRNTPLHDGAMIIREARIEASACTLPLSEATLPGHLGTRHRAALGLSERTDAVVIVVSEETGAMSVSVNGQLTSGIEDNMLRIMLRNLMGASETQPIRLVSHRATELGDNAEAGRGP
jgi:diadenylate cyclase